MSKPINWRDILIHCAVAFSMAAGAGAGLQIAFASTEWLGTVLGFCAVAGSLGVALAFPVRERIQHGGTWGGRQSNLEWVGPAAAVPFGMAAGWWISGVLL